MKLLYILFAVLALNTNGCKSKEKATSASQNSVEAQKVKDAMEVKDVSKVKETTAKEPVKKEAVTIKNSMQKGMTVTYKATSRGFNETITIDGENAVVSSYVRGKQQGPTTKKLSQEDAAIFQKYMGNIDINRLQKLEAPSKRHQFDGAPGATVTISNGKESYSCPTFDADNPPKEIAGLVKTMMKYK